MGHQLYSNNLINNDIKTDNMMLDFNGDLVMIDPDTIRTYFEDKLFDDDCLFTPYVSPLLIFYDQFDFFQIGLVNCNHELDLY